MAKERSKQPACALIGKPRLDQLSLKRRVDRNKDNYYLADITQYLDNLYWLFGHTLQRSSECHQCLGAMIAEDIARSLETLPNDFLREVVMLHHALKDGRYHSYKAVAQMLNVDPAQVSRADHHAIELLQAYFQFPQEPSSPSAHWLI